MTLPFDNQRAAALKYDGTDKAPIVVASGSGYIAQKIIETAQANDVPIYHDNSLATLLSQLQCGREIPVELYQAIVDIYVYFLNYAPNKNEAVENPVKNNEAVESPVNNEE